MIDLNVYFDHKLERLTLIEEQVPLLSCADWLMSQPLYPKVYFKEKGSSIIRASAGAHLFFTRPPKIQGDKEVRLYGGKSFFPNYKEETWVSFPKSAFWLPSIELSCDAEKGILRKYTKNSIEIPSDLPLAKELPPCNRHCCFPSYTKWEHNVSEVLQSIDKKEIEKVVLARKTSLFFESPPSPFALLNLLEEQESSHTLFFFQFAPNSAFFGMTPELLYCRTGNKIMVEAVAGTKRDPASFSSKEMREFTLVKKEVEQQLSRFASSIRWQQDGIIATNSFYHLYNKMTASCHSSACDADLLDLLHPTPALGGYPRKQACAIIEKLEPFDRGWYGAPIGMLSQEKSSFSVAIRSGLFHHKQIDLFTGVGIVEGSLPFDEWEELDAKLAWFRSKMPLYKGGS